MSEDDQSFPSDNCSIIKETVLSVYSIAQGFLNSSERQLKAYQFHRIVMTTGRRYEVVLMYNESYNN